MWPTDEELEEYENLYEQYLAREQESREQEQEITMPWEEAYELNKTRNSCILCGRPTKKVSLLDSVISYCFCVEKYIKK